MDNEHPEDLIYDIIIEKTTPPYTRVIAFIKFRHSPGYGYFPTIAGISTPDGGQPPKGTTITSTEVSYGLKQLYWAMDNDPEPPAQRILEFFQKLNL